MDDILDLLRSREPQLCGGVEPERLAGVSLAAFALSSYALLTHGRSSPVDVDHDAWSRVTRIPTVELEAGLAVIGSWAPSDDIEFPLGPDGPELAEIKRTAGSRAVMEAPLLDGSAMARYEGPVIKRAERLALDGNYHPLGRADTIDAAVMEGLGFDVSLLGSHRLDALRFQLDERAVEFYEKVDTTAIAAL